MGEGGGEGGGGSAPSSLLVPPAIGIFNLFTYACVVHIHPRHRLEIWRALAFFFSAVTRLESPAATVEGLTPIGGIRSVLVTMTTQIAVNKTPFSISDILTDLKVQVGDHHQSEAESEGVAGGGGVKQMIYGINSRDELGFGAVRKRVDENKPSGGSSFVRRGSLECFLIDNHKNQGFSDHHREVPYFNDQQSQQMQKPLDMRRSVASSLSDTYDSGEHKGASNYPNGRLDTKTPLKARHKLAPLTSSWSRVFCN